MLPCGSIQADMNSIVSGFTTRNGMALHRKTIHTAAELNEVIGPVIERMNAAEYPDSDVLAMRLALEEAIVNAIKHGHQGDPKKAVRVRYQVTARQVLAEVRDQGPGFDPNQVPDPTAPENLERATGRGLFLMRHFTTWVRFNRRGNCVTLCLARSGKAKQRFN